MGGTIEPSTDGGATSTLAQDAPTSWPAAAMLGLAFLFYAALTLVHTWPLARHLSDRLAADGGDPALNAWILWWNATTTPLSGAWWDGLGFWPIAGTIAFSEHLLGLAWLTSPIIWMGGSPALAYNIAILASFALSAWGAHLLGWRLTGRHDAGFVAGLAFGFATIRAGHLSHLQVLTTGWMPLALLGLHEFWRTRRPRWLALFAVAWLLQALSNNYYALFFSVLVTLWLAWFGLRRDAIGRLTAAAGASILAAMLLLPLVRGYHAVHETHGLQRGMEEAALFSADLAAFLNAPRALWLWGWLQTEEWGERELFGGVTALSILGVLAWRRRFGTAMTPQEPAAPAPTQSRWRTRARRTLIASGAVVLLLGVFVALDGRERHTIAGIELSTRHPEKQVMVGVLLLAAAAMLSARVQHARRRREALGFYVVAWAACLVLSLGPDVRLFDTKLLYRAPYGLLFGLVPGFDGVRAPARFAVLAALALSVAAALAFARLTTPGRRTTRLAALAVAIALVAEGSLRHMPLATLPDAPPATLLDPVVLELPIGDVFDEAAALYRTSAHRHRLVNGYSGHEPLFYHALRDGLELGEVAALVELTTLTAVTVVIDRRRDPEGRWQRMTEAAGATAVANDGHFVVLRAARQGSAPPLPAIQGEPLAIAGVDSARPSERTPLAIDGDLNTAWGTNGFQERDDALIVDLGRVASITGVEIEQGWWLANVPREIEIAVAAERGAWRPVWRGVTAVQTMRAALANPRQIRLSMPFASSAGRYVQVRQTAAQGRTAWSVAELRVMGAPVLTGATAVTPP